MDPIRSRLRSSSISSGLRPNAIQPTARNRKCKQGNHQSESDHGQQDDTSTLSSDDDIGHRQKSLRRVRLRNSTITNVQQQHLSGIIDNKSSSRSKRLEDSKRDAKRKRPRHHFTTEATDEDDDENSAESKCCPSSPPAAVDPWCCPVPGCDSRGHLSGCFEWHCLVETCPVFHNQTADECRTRHQARRLLAHRPDNRNQLLSKRARIMSQREADVKSIQNHNNADAANSIMSSSRQPSLAGSTPSFDLELFLEAQSRAARLIQDNCATPGDDSVAAGPRVQSIVFGRHEIGVWYSSPYSEEFRHCRTLYLCEYCLKCMNSEMILRRHLQRCQTRRPPGNEIYRKGNISFFEIDGNQQKEYCQNLCLLAKLFLDYKTLFVDVEPFLFYLMTENDSTGMHLIGYFSKEKYSPTSYNVSCIMTLPQHQRRGYGRMLIDFSYLLTRVENKVGTPEKPISDLGIISYRSYWKNAIMEYLSTYQAKDTILLKDMSQQTGINSADIVSTLQLMGLLKYWKGKHLILVPDQIRKRFADQLKKRPKKLANKMIDGKCLQWTPTVYPRAR